MRFILAIGVVASHTHGYRFDLYPDTGIVAVCTFFFLSGFLMPATLNKNYSGQSRPYLANRILRIFPMYWLTLAAALIVLPLLPQWKDAYDFSSQPIFQNVILLGLNQWPNDTLYIGPAWTLDIELQYYFLVPILMLVPSRIRVGLMLATSAIGIYMLLHPTGLRHIDRSFIPWSVYFFAGMMLYMKAPKFRLFKAGGKIDRELGELAYPLFIAHPLVIQVTNFHLPFWLLMTTNTVVSIAVAFLIYRAVSPSIERLRNRNRHRLEASAANQTA